MLKIFSNIKENLSLQKKIELEAKESERKYLESHYTSKIEDIRKTHAIASQKSQETYEGLLRTQEKTLKDQHRLNLEDNNDLHKKEVQELNQNIVELKKEIQDNKILYEKEQKSREEFFEKEKTDIKLKYEEELSKIKEIFVQEVRDLRTRLDEATSKLKDAQRGYFIYLKYAVLSFHYIKELRAESEAWVQHSITYKQRMEHMHSKFNTIDKFNEKTEPLIKEMLHYNKESDEDIIDAVLKEFEQIEISSQEKEEKSK